MSRRNPFAFVRDTATRWDAVALVIVLGLLAALAPRDFARILLVLAIAALLTDAAIAAVHVGVELQWWPSPLPECAAPRFAGGSIAERLANMPMRPAKPCEDPTYLIPGLPISMAPLAHSTLPATFRPRKRMSAIP